MKKITCTLMVSLLVIALTFSVSAAIPYDNMIGLYDMEGSFKDGVSDKPGTLMNGASLVADAERGNVLYLNNDDVVSPGTGLGYDSEGQHAILADSHIPDSDQMSISIWFKINGDYRTWARVIDFGDARAQDGIGDPNRFINISPTNGSYTIGTLNINDSSEGIQNNRDRVFADLVDTDVWVHAVLVINADSGNPNTLYINGQAFQSTHGGEFDDAEAAEFSPKEILESIDGVGQTFLGRSRFQTNGDQIFNGYIDDVSIFNVALTADQVKELMDAKSSDLRPVAVTTPVEEPAVDTVETPAAVEETPDTTPETPVPETSTPAPSAAPATGDMSTFILLAVFAVSGLAIVKIRKVK